MPSVDELLRYLRGRDTGLSCVACGGSEHLIVDDGEPVCRICVMRWGDAAGRPERLPVTIAAELVLAHGDVVDLVRFVVPGGSAYRWIWTPNWPLVGEEPSDPAIARRLAAIASERPSSHR